MGYHDKGKWEGGGMVGVEVWHWGGLVQGDDCSGWMGHQS